MSVDTTHDRSEPWNADQNDFLRENIEPLATDQWDALKRKINTGSRRSPASEIFAGPSHKGSVYRWGVAVARGGPIDPLWQELSRLAIDPRPSKKSSTELDFAAAAAELMDTINASSTRLWDAVRATLWAAAMPAMIDRLHHRQWWELLSALQNYRESITRRETCDSPVYLIAGGELGLTLCWQLADLPSCLRLKKSSIQSVSQWCKQDDESIASSIQHASHARLVFASLIRCQKIIHSTTRKKFKKQQARVALELAGWIAAMTTCGGGNAMSAATPADAIDDRKGGGLLQEVIACDPESLKPAVDAALGKRQTNGRLAWEVCLPDSFQHCEDAKLAVLLPQWDKRRGRVHVDYGAKQTWLELFAGRPIVLCGKCQTSIEINDQAQWAVDDWVATCEFTDDDVHYLEIEQLWSGGIVLQRQIMVIREDQCVLLADTILPSGSSRQPEVECSIRYRNRMPLAERIQIQAEPETRDVFFSDGRRRGLVMPLSANEWRVGPSNADLTVTQDKHLLLTATGLDRLFAPLWFDFQRRRFDRKRTWRKLTVADNLRIVADCEAVGFRIQSGSEQWMLYRSLANPTNRSVLGRHLVTDFFAARFHAGDGSFEELVTVDENESNDE
jgi:hypothetical protein